MTDPNRAADGLKPPPAGQPAVEVVWGAVDAAPRDTASRVTAPLGVCTCDPIVSPALVVGIKEPCGACGKTWLCRECSRCRACRPYRSCQGCDCVGKPVQDGPSEQLGMDGMPGRQRVRGTNSHA